MKRRWQFSLAYALLEIFWIAVTLALAREAYWLWFRHAEFFGAWVPPDPQKGSIFLFLVVAAVVCGSTAAGGLFGRMRLGALLAVSGFTAIAVLFAINAVFSPAIQ